MAYGKKHNNFRDGSAGTSMFSEPIDMEFTKPMAAMVIGNSMLSAVKGVSAAGATPEDTLFTPNLDARLILSGTEEGKDVPVSPLGCVSPAVVVHALFGMCGIEPVVVNAGLVHRPDFVCTDVYGEVGQDPRHDFALKDPRLLYRRGVKVGTQWGTYADLLILGECVPGGTTTALCVMKALGYNASASSSFPVSPTALKGEICNAVLKRIRDAGVDTKDAFEVMKYAGDPMMPVVSGIVRGFREANSKRGSIGNVVLSGGTQMLAVCALIKAIGDEMPPFITTKYVRDDKSAAIEDGIRQIGAKCIFVDPHFENIGIPPLERYCKGEVKEGTIFGGSILLAHLLGYSEEEIRTAIRDFMNNAMSHTF
jgi:NaMN:DMB phosphoribosyltransferase